MAAVVTTMQHRGAMGRVASDRPMDPFGKHQSSSRRGSVVGNPHANANRPFQASHDEHRYDRLKDLLAARFALAEQQLAESLDETIRLADRIVSKDGSHKDGSHKDGSHKERKEPKSSFERPKERKERKSSFDRMTTVELSLEPKSSFELSLERLATVENSAGKPNSGGTAAANRKSSASLSPDSELPENDQPSESGSITELTFGKQGSIVTVTAPDDEDQPHVVPVRPSSEGIVQMYQPPGMVPVVPQGEDILSNEDKERSSNRSRPKSMKLASSDDLGKGGRRTTFADASLQHSEITEAMRHMVSGASMDEEFQFRVHAGWTRKHSQASFGAPKNAQSMVHLSVHTKDDRGLQLGRSPSVIRIGWAPSATHPQSTRRGMWDLVSFVFVLYDMVVIPLNFFEVEENLLFYSMRWLTRLFWTLDIAASFATGYLSLQGAIETRMSMIALRYVKSWFLLDILIVGADWLEMTFEDSSSLSMARISKASRIFRILRLVRLLRLLRVRELVVLIMERIRSERLIIMAQMGQLMMMLIFWSHLIACIWYGIGADESKVARGEPTWIQAFFPGDPNAYTFGYRYSSSLHWSMSQLTGGMDEIRPFNMDERLFSIAMFLVCFVFATVFVSHLTSAMTQLNIMTSNQMVQLAALRRFLLENNISDFLSVRVTRNAQHAIEQTRRYIQEDVVDLLHYTSRPLRIELHFEMYSPQLSVHPFLGKYTVECPHVMRQICHDAVSMAVFTAGDLIFSAGEISSMPSMYIISTGELQYSNTVLHEEEENGTAFADPEVERTLVTQGSWVSEQALWIELWMHRGTLIAASQACRLCAVDGVIFQEIVSNFENQSCDPREYAALFVAEMNKRRLEVSDLPMEFRFNKEDRDTRQRSRISFGAVLTGARKSRNPFSSS